MRKFKDVLKIILIILLLMFVLFGSVRIVQHFREDEPSVDVVYVENIELDTDHIVF